MKPFADKLILINLLFGGLIAFVVNLLTIITGLTHEINLVFVGFIAVSYTAFRLWGVF